MNFLDIITVQAATFTRDVYGQEVITHTDRFTVGASIKQASGTISVSAAKETESIVMFFDLPRTPNTFTITTDNRIVTVDGVNWDIYNVDHYTMERNKVIRITARLRR